LRPESACCQHQSSSTTSTTTSSTVSSISIAGLSDTTFRGEISTNTEQIDIESKKVGSESDTEILVAEPSQIDEVYVKISGENIEANLISTSTSKPEKYAPRFCLKLKFNCKLRLSHACCKYPLPPRDEQVASTTAHPKAVKLPARPTRIQIAPVRGGERNPIKRNPPFRRPLRPQQKTTEKKTIEEDPVKDSFEQKKEPSDSKRQAPSRVQKPQTPKRNISNFLRRKRPQYNSIKSSVCRIINCKRNKKHKCCQKPKESKTTTTIPTTSTTSIKSITELLEPNVDIVEEREDTTKTFHEKVLINSNEISVDKTDVEDASVQKLVATTDEPFSEAETAKEEMNIDYETSTVIIAEQSSSTFIKHVDENKKEEVYEDNEIFDGDKLYAENFEYETATYANTEPHTVAVADNGSIHSSEQPILKEDHINDAISNRDTSSQDSEKDMGNMIEATTMSTMSYYSNEYDDYEQYIDQVSYHPKDKDSSAQIYISPSNTIQEQEALDPNQILPRVAVECFRFDCLTYPDHECCPSHNTRKRQIVQEEEEIRHKQSVVEHMIEKKPGRVTATVTRVQKTVRW